MKLMIQIKHGKCVFKFNLANYSTPLLHIKLNVLVLAKNAFKKEVLITSVQESTINLLNRVNISDC